jgi:hypothetical protein
MVAWPVTRDGKASKLDTLERVARTLGTKLVISIEDRQAPALAASEPQVSFAEVKRRRGHFRLLLKAVVSAASYCCFFRRRRRWRRPRRLGAEPPRLDGTTA